MAARNLLWAQQGECLLRRPVTRVAEPLRRSGLSWARARSRNSRRAPAGPRAALRPSRAPAPRSPSSQAACSSGAACRPWDSASVELERVIGAARLGPRADRVEGLENQLHALAAHDVLELRPSKWLSLISS